MKTFFHSATRCLLLAAVFSGSMFISATRADKLAAPEVAPENIEITDWEIGYNQPTRSWRVKVKLKNSAQREIEDIAVRVVMDDRQARRVGDSKWQVLKAIKPLADGNKSFSFEGPESYGVLYLKVRYFFAPEKADEKGGSKGSMKKALIDQVGREDRDSSDEQFFTLDGKELQRYSDAAIDRAIARKNAELMGEDAAKAEAASTEGTISFPGMEMDVDDKGNSILILTVVNGLQDFRAGQLQIDLKLNDGEGKTLHTIEHTVREAFPRGKEKKITFPAPNVDFRAWEVGYKY